MSTFRRKLLMSSVSQKGIEGVFYVSSNGYLTTVMDSTSISVAVVTPDCVFMIYPYYVNGYPWSYDTTMDVQGVPSSMSVDVIKTYYDGQSYSQAMLDNDESTVDCAVFRVRSISLNFGDTPIRGHIGSCGEWAALMKHHEAVHSMLVEVYGGGLDYSGSFQTSCEYSPAYCYVADLSNMNLGTSRKDYNISAVSFFKLDKDNIVIK